MGCYLKNLLISIDQLCNTLLAGNPDETMSSRASHLRSQGHPIFANVIDWIFFWQPNHCKESEEDINE